MNRSRLQQLWASYCLFINWSYIPNLFHHQSSDMYISRKTRKLWREAEAKLEEARNSMHADYHIACERVKREEGMS